jgi:hypothetical protein
MTRMILSGFWGLLICIVWILPVSANETAQANDPEDASIVRLMQEAAKHEAVTAALDKVEATAHDAERYAKASYGYGGSFPGADGGDSYGGCFLGPER